MRRIETDEVGDSADENGGLEGGQYLEILMIFHLPSGTEVRS